MANVISNFDAEDFFNLSEDLQWEFLANNNLEIDFLSNWETLIKTDDTGERIWQGVPIKSNIKKKSVLNWL
jgi:hypothetical protein